MTQKEFDKFISHFGEAMNRRDLEALFSLYAEGAVRQGPGWGDEYHGREAIRRSREPLFRAFPNFALRVHRYFWAGDYGVAEWSWTGTHTGAFETPQGTIAPTGKRVELSGVSLWEFDRYGHIVKERLYSDTVALLSQLGLAQARAA